MTRSLWLLFWLLVALMIGLPKILHAQPQMYVLCDQGFCVMSEQVFDALARLAKLAGKDCT